MKNLARPASGRHYQMRRSLPAALMALSLLTGGVATSVVAAPAQPAAIGVMQAQNVDWMSPETAVSLDIGIDVMVPSWVPEPFSGVAPSVTASEGYYQIYWMVPGGSPTFLYIQGTSGGSLPAGSPADLNSQLSVNASVQGWNAIHDIGIPAGGSTPIYDQVWWIANGVLYTVSSNNMTGSDSLSLANSLIVLRPPAPSAPVEPVPPAEPAPVDEVPVANDPVVVDDVPVADDPIVDDVPLANDSRDDVPVADEQVSAGPDALADQVVNEQIANEQMPPEIVADPPSADTETTSEPPAVIVPVNEPLADSTGAIAGSAETSGSTVDTSVGETLNEQGAWSPDRNDGAVPSDGTNGPLPPLIGSDGTGGLYDTALPSILFRP